MIRWLMLLALLPFTVLQAQSAPHPDLTPEQVVQAQLDALKAGTDGDLRTVYGFASPRNRIHTGPAERFVAMLRDGYGQMISHRSAELGPMLLSGDEALQPVALVDRRGEEHRFAWLLGRYDLEGCSGCWFTEAVLPPEAMGGTSAP